MSRTGAGDSPRHGAERTLLERVELGVPDGLWEGHLADGRREAVGRLLSWAAELGGADVVDAGCGYGTIAVELARRGARVLACDTDPGRVFATARRARRHGEEVSVIAADVAAPGPWSMRPMAWWCWELFEHLPRERRIALLRGLEDSRAVALFLGARIESRLGGLVHALRGADAEDSLAVLDPVQLLRDIHLETGLRLERTETLRRRNSSIAVAVMRR